ncbi:MAG TPA: hypothetical protein VGM98_00995, partial [Schlesneria sp.]
MRVSSSSVGTMVLTWICLTSIGLGSSTADAQLAIIEVLNPKTYRAPAGQYSLTVDPSDRHGCGEATYRFQENGQDLWSTTLPFTLWDAGVTDKGTIAGYAYTRGRSGVGEPGEFVVVVMDRQGKILRNDVTKRQSSRFIHGPTDPIARGLMLDEPNDRLVVRVSDPDLNRGWESWWIYRLSTATAVEKLVPASLMTNAESANGILVAKPVPGTALTLVHWWRQDMKKGRRVGARFTLAGLDAKPVWELELPDDYSVRGDSNHQDKLQNLIQRHGGILRCDETGRFDLLFAAKSLRVTFAVQNVSGTWKVSKIAETKHRLATLLNPQPVKLPERPLAYLGTLELRSKVPSPDSPIRKIRTFTFDDKGGIAFLRIDEDARSPIFVQFDQNGKLLHEIPVKVDVEPDSKWTGCSWIGSSRFVLTNSGAGIEAKSKAWWVDVKTHELTAVTGFDCPSIDRLVGFPDGGFVALATMRYRFTSQQSVFAFNKRGEQLWKRDDDYNNNKGNDALFGVDDIAMISRDEIVVLENSQKQVKCFSRQGHLQRKFDLAKSWKRDPNYPTRITSDVDAGFIVEDFNGSPPFIRMKHDGTVRSEFTPKYRDGRLIDTSDGVQASPDGRLWTCDGDCLVKLNDQGIADLVLGQAPQVETLNEIAGIAIDTKGQLHAVDKRTGSIHVFDDTGKLLHICKARPTDFEGALFNPAVTINDQGEVYLGLGRGPSFPDEARDFAHFSVNGQRLENVTLPANRGFMTPGSGNVIALQYEDMVLVDRSGKIIRKIRRRPDGNWLVALGSAAMGTDGSIAVISGWAVHLYEPNGDPIRTIPLPDVIGNFPRIAYDGRRLLIAGDDVLWLLDRSGTPQGILTPEKRKVAQKEYWTPHLIPDSRQVLLFEANTAK